MFLLRDGKWLSLLNLFLLLLLCASAAFFFFPQSQEIESVDFTIPKKTELPASPFKKGKGSEKIGERGPFALEVAPFQLMLPDLHDLLIYCGPSGRPSLKPLLRLGLKNSSEMRSVALNQKIFLCREKRGEFAFAPKGEISPLWMEAVSADGEVMHLKVFLEDGEGALITSPEKAHSLILHRTAETDCGFTSWEIGSYRVDPSLLIRQRARIAGRDYFLERCGGERFNYVTSRERIDFMDDKDPYFCFVKEGDLLVWKEGKWTLTENMEEIDNQPVMLVKKIDDKLFTFELWDGEGRGKISLNLVRARFHDWTPDPTQEFKFAGAKTWAQFALDCRGERIIVRPNDWLLFKDQQGWCKISTAAEVEDFVSQKIQGALFIVDKMVRSEGRQYLQGVLFNASRTEMHEVELDSASAKPHPLIHIPEGSP